MGSRSWNTNETTQSSSLGIVTNWANTFLRQQKYNHSRKQANGFKLPSKASSANFHCKTPDSKYFRLCQPYSLQSLSQVLSSAGVCESTYTLTYHRQHLSERLWLGSNKTVFTTTGGRLDLAVGCSFPVPRLRVPSSPGILTYKTQL